MGLLEIQAVEPPPAEEQQQGQHHGNQEPDALADARVLPGLLLFPGPQGLPGQRHRRHLHAVGEGEAQAQDVHADVMGRELIRAQPGRQQGRRQETHPHGDVFQGGIIGQAPDGLQALAELFQARLQNQAELHVTFSPEEGEHRHGRRNHGPQHRGDGRAANAQGRKAQIAADEQIIEQHVDHAAGQVGDHGEAGIAAPPLGRVDHHGQHVENRAPHDDPEVFHRRLVGIGVAAGQGHHPGRENHEHRRNDRAQHQRQSQGGGQHMVGALPVSFSLSAGHQGGHGDVDAEKQGQGDKLGLVGEPHSRHGVAAQGGNHHGVDHARQGHKKALRHGGPGHRDGLPGHLPALPLLFRGLPCRFLLVHSVPFCAGSLFPAVFFAGPSLFYRTTIGGWQSRSPFVTRRASPPSRISSGGKRAVKSDSGAMGQSALYSVR